MDPVFSAKRNIPLTTDFKKCIICQESSSNDNYSALTSKGIGTFKNAIERRKDEVYDRLWNQIIKEEEFLSMSPILHRGCRSRYTHKKEIDHLSCKKPKLQPSETSTLGTCKRSSAIDLKKVCFLCGKERDLKGVHKLSFVASRERQQSIYDKAKLLHDDKLLIQIRGIDEKPIDMIAAKYRYHKQCMDTYMNKRVLTIKEENDLAEEAFEDLVMEIDKKIIKDKSAFFLIQLNDKYRQILEERGMSNAGSYRTDRLKKRIVDHYGSSLQIISQLGKPSLVCSSSITVGEMCNLMISLMKNFMENESPEFGDADMATKSRAPSTCTHYHSAKVLRSQMKEVLIDNVGLEISHESALKKIPTDMFNFLSWLLTDNEEFGDDGRAILERSDHEKVLNISQDIMAHVTKTTMPKHVGIALHILKQTRSKDLVRILHNFGHSISYDSAQRYLSTVVNNIDSQTQRDGFFIPSNLVPGRFLQCALDNLDFAENTKDGTTLHSTSHNIYQYINQSCTDDPPAACVPLKKSRRKSVPKGNEFYPHASFLQLKERRNARSLRNVQLTADREENSELLIHLEDNLLILALIHLYRGKEGESPTPLSWNSFHDIIEDQPKKETSINYGPLFPQSPTNPDVVQTSLDYFQSLTNKLCQTTTVVTADQAIYDILKGLKTKYPQKYSQIVIRLGGFHIAENFLGAIGFFMKNSGLEDILVESGISKRGTANKVLAGKDYYKMNRFHTLMCEAMIHLVWSSFEDFCLASDEYEVINNLHVHLSRLSQSLHTKNSAESRKMLKEVRDHLSSMTTLWKSYLEGIGVTAKYWLMYISMVQIFKRYICAERSGNWMGHLLEVQNMLPYVVSAGHRNYAVCIPLYLKDMHQLSTEHPEVYAEFMDGNFTVHRVTGRFNGVWTDLALEQTYNREGKCALLKGISQNHAAREKYIKAVPFLTKVSDSIKVMARIDHQNSSHHGASQRQIEADQVFIETIKDIVTRTMINPFSTNNLVDLINISTGEKADSTELINAREKGITALKETEDKGATMVTLPKLITFHTPTKSKIPSKSQAAKLYQNESEVTRALCFVQSAEVTSRKEAFSHEWTTYPSSLFEMTTDQDIQMRKGNKSEFIAVLLENVSLYQPSSLPLLEISTVFLIDAMYFIQRFQHLGASTFGDLTTKYLKKIIELKPDHCLDIHIVGDRYDFKYSIKGAERERRRTGQVSREFVPAENIEIPNWNTLMSNPKNKANLLDFIVHSIAHKAVNQLPDGITLYFGGMCKDARETTMVSNKIKLQLGTLKCEHHEEADTRLMAHMVYSCTRLNHGRIVILANDTDIILLSMFFVSYIPEITELWMYRNEKFLPIHTLVTLLAEKYKQMPKDLCGTLIAGHVLSGCDTTSYPFRRGKRKAAKVSLNLAGSLPELCNFGNSLADCNYSEDIKNEARQFFCALYGQQSNESLNLLREHLFATQKGDIRSLPPTEDAFHFHLLRALLQLFLYKKSYLSEFPVPNVFDFGWTLVNQKLIPVTMIKTSKPEGVKPIFCKCKKSKCLGKCVCAKANLPCIIACSCFGRSEFCGRVQHEDSDDTDTNE